MTDARAERVTHGNLHRPQSIGLGGSSTAATWVLFGGVLVFVITSLTVGLLAALIVLLVALATVGVMSARDMYGLSALQRTGSRATFTLARYTGTNLYRAGLLGVVPSGKAQLPGLAAESTVCGGWDSYGRPFALIHYPSTTDYVAVFAVEPEGSALVDPWQVYEWVDQWGAYLTSLAREPGLQGCAVTVETAPDTGHRLRRTVEQAIDPAAPQVARDVLTDIVDRYPEGSAVTHAWVALTFSAATRPNGKRRSTEAVLRDLATRLPKLGDRLSSTGAGVARPVTVEELCETVRVAYDPAVASTIELSRAQGKDLGLSWDDVGPVAAEARWDRYLHDSGMSRTWTMTSPPTGVFESSVLAELLGPHPDIPRKRVTLLYRPLGAGKAAKAIKRDQQDAKFRAGSAWHTSAEMEAAEQAAREHGRGAGVINFGMSVTATVLDPGGRGRGRNGSMTRLTRRRRPSNPLPPGRR